MAFTALTPIVILPGTNGAVTYVAAAAAGNMFLNNGQCSVRIKNGGGSSITATVSSVPDPYGRSGDQVIVIAAGAEYEVSELPPPLWNQTSGNVGNVQITYSGVTSVTVAVIQHG